MCKWLKSAWQSSVAIATMGCLLALAWQQVLVHGVYDGNSTALFWFGDQYQVPAGLSDHHLFIHANTGGYDGEFYYVMGVDPFFRDSDLVSFSDAPRLRYRRVLVPLLANVMSGGRPGLLPAAFIAVQGAFVWLGIFWLARWFARHGRPVFLALGFLALPPVTISLERMTVDGVLCSLCAGFLLFADEKKRWPLFAVLAAAVLVRETGALLALAAGAAFFFRRAWMDCALCTLALVPGLAWFVYVNANMPPGAVSLISFVPFAAWLPVFLHPPDAGGSEVFATLVALLDRLSLMGPVIASVGAVRLVFVRRFDAGSLATLLFAALAASHAVPLTWQDCFAHTRSLGPLMLLAAAHGVVGRPRWLAASVIVQWPRLGLQVIGQVAPLVRTVF